MITVTKRVLRWVLSRIFHCCENCGKTAAGKVYLRKAGTLIFKPVYICQSCQKSFWTINIDGEDLVEKRGANRENNKPLLLKRKKA